MMSTQTNTSSVWFARLKSNPQARLRLFCFPYAGGSSVIFRDWQQHLPSGVEVCLAQLPGRGIRINETPLTRLSVLVEKMASAIRPYLDMPFAFFGHSMGAFTCFELARQLRRAHGLEPAHLFVSGCRAPRVYQPDELTYDLPEPEFLERLRNLNGTPQEVLEHPELMQLMSPLLRADFEAVETYSYTHETPLACPISAYGGLADMEVKRDHLEAWHAETNAAFALRLFNGDHFFIHHSQAMLLRTLTRELSQLATASA